MNLSTRVLGANIVKSLTERLHGAILTIGSDKLTRSDLATVECFNYVAARNLSNALSDLGVKSTRDLFNNVPPASLALPGIGAIALAVLGAAFEKAGIGGDAPLESWMVKHRGDADVEHAVATFTTVKHRANAEATQEKRDKKQRKEARRHKAHRLRSERFAERSARVH